MIPEARNFFIESEALYQLIRERTDSSLRQLTAFKAWSFEDIIRHLHVWNRLAHLSLSDKNGFEAAIEQLLAGLTGPGGIRASELEYTGNIAGSELLQCWYDYSQELADAFSAAPPELRVPWAGPPMSAQSSIIARLMETWAHGQAIFDFLGVERKNSDHIYSIAELGVRTYRWTFANRQQDAPLPKPFVRLTAPSGKIWSWNEEREDEYVEGDAVEFCQVVTQTRNVKDTSLIVSGVNASQWMSIAQCFAGPAEAPPAKGQRMIKKVS